MGNRNKAKKPPEPPEEDSVGMEMLESFAGVGNDWGADTQYSRGWDPIEEEEEDEEEEEEEEEEPPPPRKGKKGGGQQQQHQNGGGQQKGNKNNQQQSGSKGKQTQPHNQQQYQQHNQQQYQHYNQQQNPQYNQQQNPQYNQQQNPQYNQQQNPQYNQQHDQKQHPQNSKAPKAPKQKGQKGQKGQQEQGSRQEWGGGGGDWGVPNESVAPSWGDGGGGGSDWGQPMHQPMHPGPSHQRQQHRLASLLEETPPSRSPVRGDRRRMSGSSHQQWPGPARPHTPAEHVKAAANGRTPSRTLWFAATGSTSSVLDGGARNAPHTTVQIVDSGGLALEEADRALFSHQRPANQRIHWMFSPTKDERVSSLLDWIQAMSHALATVGLHKYLRSQKRGALMANADFRPWKSPNDPAFDWLTFDDVVDTHDKTLQESMAFYEPESQVLVFVFLLSPSGNSLAMWRRKLPVPNAVRSQHRAEITKLTSALAKRKYVITVDELPPPPPKPKKKWFNVRW